MSPQSLGYLLSGCALLSFTTAILVTKKATSLMPLGLGFLIATATNVLFAALAFGAQMAAGRALPEWNGAAMACFAGAGVLSTYLGRWFFYESVVLWGPAKASIFQVSNPLFTALVAWLALGEALTASTFLGMALAVAGLILISVNPMQAGVQPAGSAQASASQAVAGARGARLWARWKSSILVLGLGSALAYSLGNVLRGAAIRDWNEPLLGGLLGALSGLLLHFCFMPEKRDLLGQLRQAPQLGIWLFALLGAATIAGQIFSIAAMRYVPISVTNLVTLCSPLLVIPLSRVFYKTAGKTTPDVVLGAVLTVAGVGWVLMR
jgi:drug/metabolite transporter (DMT)-like permease